MKQLQIKPTQFEKCSNLPGFPVQKLAGIALGYENYYPYKQVMLPG
jgi:hypothetical protein